MATKQDIANLYLALFNRVPDEEGLNYWETDTIFWVCLLILLEENNYSLYFLL